MRSFSRTALCGIVLFSLGLALLAFPVSGQIETRKLSDLHAIAGDVESVELSPDGQWAVYRADQDQAHQIELYAVRLDGGPSIKLNTPFEVSGQVSQAKISPDGSRVVYRANGGNLGESGLFSVSIDGGTPTRLSGPPGLRHLYGGFALSADGEHVVFRAFGSSGFPQMFRTSLSGGTVEPLGFEAPGSDAWIQEFWISPDGQTVIYLASRLTEGITDLYRVAMTGGGGERLSASEANSRHVVAVDFALGGDLVLYKTRPPEATHPALFSVPTVGGPSRLLDANLVDRLSGPGFTVSPDGRHIVYPVGQPDSNMQRVYSMNLLTGESVALDDVFASFHTKVTISPDSRFVFYLGESNFRSTLFRIPIEGGEPLQLSIPETQGTASHPVVVSPDGKQVVFAARWPDGRQRWALWSVPTSGEPGAMLAPSVPIRDEIPAPIVQASGQQVIFFADGPTHDSLVLLQASLMGGLAIQLNAPLPVGGSVQPMIALTRDEEQVVYMADQDSLGVVGLFAVPATGGNPRQLSDEMVDTAGAIEGLQVSARGGRAVYAADRRVEGHFELLSADLATGDISRLDASPEGSSGVREFELSPQEDWVVFLSSRDDHRFADLWSAPVAGGPAVRLNVHDGEGFGVTAFRFGRRGKTVIYRQAIYPGHLFAVPVDGGALPVQLTPMQSEEEHGGIDSFWISPDGHRVIYRRRKGDLFSVPILETAGNSSTGAEETRLTENADAPGYRSLLFATPDGSRVVFATRSDASQRTELYRTADGGGPPIRLSARGPNEASFASPVGITPDGERLIYLLDADVLYEWNLYSVPMAGGASTRLNARGAGYEDVGQALLSPSGKHVLFTARKTDSTGESIFRVGVEGGTAAGEGLQRLDDVPEPAGTSYNPQFGEEGQTVAFLHWSPDSGTGLWSVPFAGGKPVRLSGSSSMISSVDQFWVNPNQSSVIYQARRAGDRSTGLFHVPIAGGLVTPVTDAAFTVGAEHPGRLRRLQTKWSRDGLAFVFTALPESPVLEELWVTTGFPERLRLRPPVSFNTATGVHFYKGME